jgi:hypothetical protein
MGVSLMFTGNLVESRDHFTGKEGVALSAYRRGTMPTVKRRASPMWRHAGGKQDL